MRANLEACLTTDTPLGMEEKLRFESLGFRI